MSRLHLYSTVAASLLLATASAAAQGVHTQMPERAPAAQQHAPAEKIAPPMNAGTHGKAETTGQASSGTNASEHGKAGLNSGKTGSMNSEKNEVKDSNGNPSAGVKEKADSRSGASKSNAPANKEKSTTGQGAAAGAHKLTTHQRTKITTIIKKRKVKPAHLNISVHVGARIPATVHFYPLPVQVVEVYPEWRGYDFILVGDEIVIINPRSHEIVAILET